MPNLEEIFCRRWWRVLLNILYLTAIYREFITFHLLKKPDTKIFSRIKWCSGGRSLEEKSILLYPLAVSTEFDSTVLQTTQLIKCQRCSRRCWRCGCNTFSLWRVSKCMGNYPIALSARSHHMLGKTGGRYAVTTEHVNKTKVRLVYSDGSRGVAWCNYWIDLVAKTLSSITLLWHRPRDETFHVDIACQRCSNYIFTLHLTLGFDILRKDSIKPRRETFKFWDLARLRDFVVC